MHPPLLSIRDIQHVISLCLSEPSLRARRDAALFALVWCGQLSIPQAVRLHVEAAKRIVTPCGSHFIQAVQRWMEIRPDVEGPFLLAIGRRGQIEAQAMPATTAAEIIRRRTAEAKVGYVTPQELLRAAVLAARNSPYGMRTDPSVGSCDHSVGLSEAPESHPD